MTKIQVISVSKVKQSFVKEGEAEYIKRLKPYLSLGVDELGVSLSSALSPAEVMKKEADAFRKKLSGGLFIALDERGKQYNSQEFASFFESQMEQYQSITFGIGGAFGWDEELKREAGSLLSLSSLTFPYQLSRLVLIEQIYRAMSIIRGLPYHKE